MERIKKNVIVILISIVLFYSCKKNTNDVVEHSSIKIIATVNEPKQAKMISSINGNLLAFVTSGTMVTPAMQQELFLMKPSGEVIKSFHLSDTIFQFMSAVRGINGGFFISASGNNLPYIASYKIDDNANITWSNYKMLSISNYNINEPAVTISYDNNYMLMYQKYGSGYYIQKIDQSGNEIFDKKIPSPAANHYGTGLNYGEKFIQFYQANDTMIIIQGITYDLYSQMIENCFLRAVSNDVVKKWYSNNYDSTHIEVASGLYNSTTNKILLFASKTTTATYEGFGDVFTRTYSLNGTMENETMYSRVGGTPTNIKHTITSPDGGFLMVGSNSQLPANDLVSPNNIVLIKLNADLKVNWTKTINTSYPAKGFDIVNLPDGSLGLVGLLKDNYSTNKLMYLHLDAFGDVIIN